MNKITVASNVIYMNTCNRASNWQVDIITYLINIYLFIYLKFEALLDIHCLTSFSVGSRCPSVTATAALSNEQVQENATCGWQWERQATLDILQLG